MPRLIAHLSDLHFGTEIPEVVAALAEDITALKPDLVAVSGDLTQRAHHHEFEAAMAFLRALPAPFMAVPGNHDITQHDLVERFTDPYRRWRRHVGPDPEPVWQEEEVAVVGLNTARRMQPHLKWQEGRVGRTRLERAEARLAAVPQGVARIVVAHHPFNAPTLAPQAEPVMGARRALASFARHGVKAVLTGHLHLPDLIATRHQGVLLVHAATATSHRLRGQPNAWNLIRTAPGAEPLVTTRIWNGTAWRDAEAPVTVA